MDATALHARHEPVALDIVEPIGIELAGNHGIAAVARLLPPDRRNEAMGEAAAELVIRHAADLAVADRLGADLRVRREGQLEALRPWLEGVAERAVADVLQ